ncbi:MAG: glycolate oxidase subunit GlcE, partial [Silicimonas sp.]|nr:glycolate oxidase subunit GlcE [Silicimonas sp.]
PTTESDLADAIASASEPLSIRGSGTRGLAPDGLPLTTSALTGITLYEPGSLTLVAKTGTPIADIEAALAAENQMLAFEPMDARALLGTEGEPTIGGVVATNCSGPRRVQAGACRDFLLGARFVDGAGAVIKNGGRVMKNVTGYDLARMMCGSHGTLGVLTEVSLKVLPRPEYTLTLVYEAPDQGAILHLLTEAMKSPFEVSGAAHVPPGVAGEKSAAIIRLEGFEASVHYRAEALMSRLGAARQEVERAANENLWRAVRDVTPFAEREGNVWDLSVKPSDAPSVAASASETDMMLDWACGRIWLLAPPGHDVRTRMAGVEGHATLVRGEAGTLPRFHPEPEPLASMARALRRKYDPKGILNRGLMD